MDSFVKWLEGTSASWFVNQYSWIWPACETLHFLGLALLIGNVGLLDLRLLGFLKGLPVLPLNSLVLWGVAGFTINLVTGIVFVVGDPNQYVDNVAFYFKMSFIAIAGLNLLVFYLTGISRKVALMGPGDDAPTLAKVVAATSLVLWLGVMYFGRMLPYIGNSF